VGEKAAKLPATSGVTITTLDAYNVGRKFESHCYFNMDSKLGIQFGVQDVDNYFEAVVDPSSNNLNIRRIEDGTETERTSENVTYSSGQLIYVEVDWSLHSDPQLTLFEGDSKESEIGSVSHSTTKIWTEGSLSLTSKSDLGSVLVDYIGDTSSVVNIESVQTGIDSNVPLKSIQTITNGLNGVRDVLNYAPTGDSKYNDTNFVPFVFATDRERDEDLRNRAFENTQIGGAATVDAIGSAISEIDSVKSLNVNRNRENVAVNGLPAKSFEAVVYGGDAEDIANAIFETASIDSNDVGGINGVAESYTLESDVTGSSEEINWSRPNQLELSLTLDLIVGENFVGENEIRSRIVEYIGGTDIDGSKLPGLDVGENIYESLLKQEIIGPGETDVWEVDRLEIDSDSDGTDDTIEDSSGADVLAVADNEVSVANARDGSITINITEK
jgi:hypothetical protein